ncbi:MAG: AAA family ATPase [Planctomycetes bacterium]|nr:AAA family ATPase [Planctomycetota bacterium]
MYLDKLRLQNVRGFRELDFDFRRPDGVHAGWTVIVGDNGSGKSALLKAIAIALVGRDTARSLQPSFRRWIRDGHGEGESFIQIEVAFSAGDDFFAESGRPPVGTFPARLSLRNGGREVTLAEDNRLTQPQRSNYKTPERTIWSSEARGWFSCGYGPFRRIFGASPEATRLMVAPSTERFVTMFDEAASLAEVVGWMRTLKHRELEGREAEARQLDALIQILNDGLLPNELRVARVDSEGLWLVDRTGTELSWSDMSDGYRSALALIADIVRHLVNTFGFEGLLSKDSDGRLCFQHSGVVLIDEIDAHLHPEWQREIGFWLKERFPKLQFLVTTHSPFICQAADRGGIFHLPEPGSGDTPRRLEAEELERIVASKPNSILRGPAFGLPNTASRVAVEKRSRQAALSAKRRSGGKLTDDEGRELKQLELFTSLDADD